MVVATVMGRSGILSSVAAAVTLMMTSVVAMLVLSSMVAFNGWPGAAALQNSHGAVALASLEADTPSAAQRVELGGGERAATRSTTRRARRQASARRSAQTISAVRRGASAVQQVPRTHNGSKGVTKLGTSRPASNVSTEPELPAPPVSRHETAPPLQKLADHVGASAHQVIEATDSSATPLRDLVGALHP